MYAYDIHGLLSGVLGNINSLLGVIQTHVKSYRHIAQILPRTLEKSERICLNILLLRPLMRLDGVLDNLLNQAITNLEQIDKDLSAISDELERHSASRSFSAAPLWDAAPRTIDLKF